MTASTAGSMAELDTEAAKLLHGLEGLQETPVNVETLPEWLEAWSRIKCKTQTLWAERILATKRDSNDTQAQALYKHLMSHWIPKLEIYDEPLARRALSAGVGKTRSGLARKLEAELGGQHTERLREVMAQERLLSSRYNGITSNQTVNLSGTNLLIHEVQDRLERTTEPGERKAMWQALKHSNLETSHALDQLFTDLLRTRQQVAVQAGSTNYAEHAWRQTNRDYTIQEAVEFLDGLAEVFAPLMTRLDQDLAAQLGVERMRPWDLTVKVNPPVNNMIKGDEYVARAAQIFASLDPTFGAVVRRMEAEGRIDLSPRLGKDTGNFAVHLFAHGTSEVLCSDMGGLREFGTLLHELGHAVHSHFLSSNPENLVWDFYGFMEVREFCAFVFTTLGESRVVEDFKLSHEEQRWYKRSLAESFLSRLRDVDERVRMELWLYQQTQDIAVEEIDARYLMLYQRPAVDWSDHEDMLQKGWQKRHLFLHSFYNIEYSIATVAALLFVKAYQEDPAGALAQLKQSMSMGATLKLKAIFAEAGIEFPFSKEQLFTARDVLAKWLV